LGQKILEQIQGRRVEPLQIVEKEDQRMVGSCEYSDKSSEYQPETLSRVPVAEDQAQETVLL
jgi:hypothetical protein